MSTVTATPAAPALPIWRSIGQSFVILLGNLPAIMQLYAPMIVAWLLIALMDTGLKPENPVLGNVLYGLCGLVTVINALFGAMALQLATLRNLQDGSLPIGAACREALPRLLPFILLTVIYLAIAAVSAALLFVPFLFVFPMIFLAPIIWLVERCSIPDAFQRSATLTRGHRWRILGIIVITGLIGYGGNVLAMIAKALLGGVELLAAEAVSLVIMLLIHLALTILIAVVYAHLNPGHPVRAAGHNPVL